MKKKRRNNYLFLGLTSLFLYLVYTYQDTAGFQQMMDFLFKPDKEYALPHTWQENRLLFLGLVLALGCLFYLPTWRSYKKLLHLYRNSPVRNRPPEIPPLQSSYFYRQDKVNNLASWINGMCTKGAITIEFRNDNHPWVLQRANDEKLLPDDKSLLQTLFRSENRVVLKAIISSPNTDVEETADKLSEQLKERYTSQFHQRQNRLPAWLILLFLFAEIPFFMASQDDNLVTTLPVVLFSTILAVAPVYVACKFLPSFYTGPRIVAGLLLGFSLLFVLFGHSMLFSSASTAPYLTSALYPNLAAALITLVSMAPLLPKSLELLSQIMGYRRYLSDSSLAIREEDLPWTLGLEVHADLIESGFEYRETQLPAWLDSSDEPDVQVVMKRLHQTFTHALNKAVHGEAKSSRGSGSTGMDGIYR